MRIEIISAMFGSIDELKTHSGQSILSGYRVFTETNGEAVINIKGDRVKSLYYKTQIHKVSDADILIWVDGKIQITSPDFVQQCIDQLGSNDFAILKHHERTCVYQEINHIIHCMNKGNEYLLARYKDRPLLEEAAAWQKLGYPKNNGLGDCKIFVVRNNERMNHIFNDWWNRVSEQNYFDQTTIQAVCWYNNLKINYLNFKPGSFVDVPHKVLK